MRSRRFAPLLTLLAVALPAGAAYAAFEAPVEIGQGTYRVSATAATDAAGATTAVLSGVRGGTLIVRRASAAGPWAPSLRLRARSSAARPDRSWPRRGRAR